MQLTDDDDGDDEDTVDGDVWWSLAYYTIASRILKQKTSAAQPTSDAKSGILTTQMAKKSVSSSLLSLAGVQTNAGGINHSQSVAFFSFNIDALNIALNVG